ncbi:MAG: ribosomal protein [Rickettsiaceae bacterium]|jgi:large subunit ribosomal protein L10|nr:ribosomal protein [Rickettsiaceae bacterium]
MNRTQKADLVASMRESLTKSNFVVLLHYRGLSDKQLYDFRLGLKSKGVKMKIMKNTLAKVAIKGSDLEVLSQYLSGPTAICYANDPVSLAKAAIASAKENEALKIQVGYLNKSVLSKDAIDSLSKLGSLEEVRSSFLSVLQGAQSQFVRVLNAPASGVVSVINNYVSSKK